MTVVLRAATADDSRDLWLWRNDETTRRNSRTMDVIAWDAHQYWLAGMLASPDSMILIAAEGLERAAARVGMIRFDRLETDADGPRCFRVSIVVARTARGRGLGRTILMAGCYHLGGNNRPATVLAAVRRDNLSSRRIFEIAGFLADVDAQDPGYVDYVKHLS